MDVFIVRDLVNGGLVPLDALVTRLPQIAPVFWAFKRTEFAHGDLFGLTLSEFERLTWDLSEGFVVGDQDFRRLMSADFQMIAGVIEAIGSPGVLIRIECVDAGQWEISTSDSEISTQLQQRGFSRAANNLEGRR
jgi:hypothetical protein